MIITIPMSVPYFRGIHMRKPVVCSQFTESVKDKPSQRESLVGVFIHSPIALIEIFVHGLSYFDDDFFLRSRFSSFLPVDDKRFCDFIMAFFYQYLFYGVLDGFYVRDLFSHFLFDFFRCFLGKIRHFFEIRPSDRFYRFFDSGLYSADIEIDNSSIPFPHFVDSHAL